MDQQDVKYPVYIISKGRYKNPITAKKFLKDKVPFLIAVEPQEYELYKETIPEENILKLPFSNLGLGSYPARNYCWEDSIKKGAKKHFIFDDNIYGFVRFDKGKRHKDETLNCSTPLNALADFSDQFKNLAISGYNYIYFATKDTKKAFTINTHVYSGMLIRNDIPFRWRLKYNEDVDLCLQALDEGWCTLLLNVFLICKVSTVSKMKGGNQDELYKNNDENMKLLKANSLSKIWPQYAETTLRYGRPHHYVNWKKHFNEPLQKIKTK